MSALLISVGETRVERVDEWHRDWPRVLDFIERSGKRAELQVTPAGWLSARQAVLAAFVGDEVVGHLAFHIEPLVDAMAQATPGPTLLAKLDACAVADGHDADAICASLRAAAIDWARRIHVDPEAVAQAQVA
jgi:hypothetical protein